MMGATGNIYVGLHEFVDMMFVLHILRRGDLSSHPIIMAKMDVEGYEEEVLRGAQAFLANDRLKILDLEWPTSSIRQALTSHNFRAAYYDPFSRKLQREQGNTFKSNNSLFVRDWEFVNARLTAANKIEVLGHSI